MYITISLVVLYAFYRRERWAQKKIICPKSYLILSDIFPVFFFCVLSGICLPLLFSLLPSPHMSPLRHCNSNSRGRIKKNTNHSFKCRSCQLLTMWLNTDNFFLPTRSLDSILPGNLDCCWFFFPKHAVKYD